MSFPDSTPASSTPAPTPAAPTPAPVISMRNPVAAFAALGSPLRWQIFRLLADGTPRASSQVAKAVKREYDIVNKHLKELRDAGWLATTTSEADGRFLFFYIPPVNRTGPDVIDYGWCRINLARTA